MGGCSAPFCTNSSTVGKQLFRFPKEPTRKNKWVANCRRINFEPTENSRLCQDHFEETQFEEIARSPAGGKKLKPNAIPTLFRIDGRPPYPVSNGTYLLPPLILKSEPVEKELSTGDHGYARRTPLRGMEEGEEKGEEKQSCTQCQVLKDQLELEIQRSSRLRKEAEQMKRRLFRLDQIEKGLQSFLYEDQIRALSLTKRSRRAVWSPETIMKARKIRSEVGTKGYEYLRELGYPLPSYRTLCNRLETKIMVTTDMSCEELAELGLGLMAPLDSPTEDVGDNDEEELIPVLS